MKHCPICKSEISEDKLKCEYCHTAYLMGVADGEKNIKTELSSFLKRIQE